MCAIRHADGQLFTGAADGVKIWSTRGGMPKLQTTLDDFGGSQVRGIDALDGQLLVGTKAGTIYEARSGYEFAPIMHSHN